MSGSGMRKLCFIVAMSVAVSVNAQGNSQGSPSDRKNYIRPETMASHVQRYVRALGDRVSKPGKERATFVGNLNSDAVTTPITVITELPGKVRIDRGDKKKPTVFDPDKNFSANGLDDLDHDLLEILGFDTGEKFLFSVQQISMPRLLGYAFKRPGASGFGSEADLFEAEHPIPTRGDKFSRVKQFMFDSNTGLLYRVAYEVSKGGTTARVVTEYGSYEAINGDPMPKRILRKENGRSTIDLTFSSIAIQGKVQDLLFVP